MGGEPMSDIDDLQSAMARAQRAVKANQARYCEERDARPPSRHMGHDMSTFSDEDKRALWVSAQSGGMGSAWQSFALRVDVEEGVWLHYYERFDFPPTDEQLATVWPNTPVPQERRPAPRQAREHWEDG
jgi:hypothetical protein